nr:MAG TPA: hypothetical protein [Ackermannviridae sp.]
MAKYEVTFHRFFLPFAEFTAPESALLVPDASSLAATLRASCTSSALSCCTVTASPGLSPALSRTHAAAAVSPLRALTTWAMAIASY